VSSADESSNASRRPNWVAFQAELLTTASQAGWGLWVVCVVLLAAIVVSLAVAVAAAII
jgi:hypothetical protein